MQSRREFLRGGVRYFGKLGVSVRRALTDNRRRFVPSLLLPCAESSGCARYSPDPIARTPTARPSAELSRPCANGPTAFLIDIPWSGPLCLYNWHRLHHGIGCIAPVSQLAQCRNNPLSLPT